MNNYRLARTCWLIFPVILWLGGCATQLPKDQQAGMAIFQANRAKLAELGSWQLQGRLAMTTAKEAWSATLQWIQTDGDYQLRLIAPLGRGSFELRGNDHGVILRLAQKQVLQADDPETLLQKNFGWTVPVSGLQYWIRGIPDPDAKINNLLLDDQGRINSLEQSGWQVTYTQYASQGAYELPGRITMVNVNLKLNLVIKSWKL